jgi:Cdc6-like AAA superfamily ATPase
MPMRDEVANELFDIRDKIVAPCKKCGGRGYLPVVREYQQLNPCDCMTVLHYIVALTEAKIPKNFWWMGLDDMVIGKKYKTFCQWYMKRIPNAMQRALGILFLGANGIGKTSMQCEIGKEAIVQGAKVQYFTAQQYIEAKKNNSDDTILKEYESGKFILLDEMDKIYIKTGSNYATKTIEDLLRRKISEGAVFIICTNHNKDNLENVFGQSTVSMLLRHLKFIDVEGKDYSDKLQEKYNSMIDDKRDYFDKHLTSVAKRLTDREQKDDEAYWRKEFEKDR